MSLSMTNSEEIDGLNNRKFTGLLGYEGINSKKCATYTSPLKQHIYLVQIWRVYRKNNSMVNIK